MTYREREKQKKSLLIAITNYSKLETKNEISLQRVSLEIKNL